MLQHHPYQPILHLFPAFVEVENSTRRNLFGDVIQMKTPGVMVETRAAFDMLDRYKSGRNDLKDGLSPRIA
jgi:hypothetical protein